MEKQRIEDELLGLEKSYWQAMKDKDMEKCLSLTDDPCVIAGPRGVQTIDRAKFREMMKQATHTLDAFEIKGDVEVRKLTDDVVVLAYRVHEELTVDNKAVTFEAAESATWVRRDGRWLCAMHAESVAGDPFGRDRRSDGAAASH